MSLRNTAPLARDTINREMLTFDPRNLPGNVLTGHRRHGQSNPKQTDAVVEARFVLVSQCNLVSRM
ncbi:MAG: hypothetical protein AAFY27_02860 [Pseudomonadota bacterium]